MKFSCLVMFMDTWAYVHIQLAARQAATVPFPPRLVAPKLGVFFLSGTVRCVHFTSILESLGSILVAFGTPGQGSGFLWALFGDGSIFEVSGTRNPPIFWNPF